MIRRLLLPVSFAALALAAGDPWSRLREVKGGIEIRVYREGSAQPLLGKMDELTAEHLRLVVRNKQIAIPKAEIDRVEARGGPVKRRVVSDTRAVDPDPQPRAGANTGPRSGSGNASGYSSSTSFETTKPDFEVVYRRSIVRPKERK